MNKRFIKTSAVFNVVKRSDPSAFLNKHKKTFTYSSSSACTCCADIVLCVDGYLLYTSLSNKTLRDLGVKTNSPKDFWGCY